MHWLSPSSPFSRHDRESHHQYVCGPWRGGTWQLRSDVPIPVLHQRRVRSMENSTFMLAFVKNGGFGPPTDFDDWGRQFAKELLNDCICSEIIKHAFNWMNSVFLFIYLHIAPPGYCIIDSRTQSSQVCVQLMLSRLCSASVFFLFAFSAFCLWLSTWCLCAWWSPGFTPSPWWSNT